MKGGNTIQYDYDLYREDLAGGGTSLVAGLGSTNWNLAFADDENLFVVGAEAQNGSLVGEAQVAAAPTGFVESTFYWIEGPCSDSPTIHRRDVNLESKLQQLPQAPLAPIAAHTATAIAGPTPIPTTGPVAKAKALAQLTDVVPFLVAGEVEKVFFTAFSSDRVGVIEPGAGVAPISWPLRRIGIAPIVGPVGSMAGPRGLALKAANPAAPGDPGDRLYVLNRLDSSVAIVDPLTEVVVGGFALAQDPTPAHVRAGRRFLYSAKLSGNGFVSCSSCHTDARTDGLAWDLSDGAPAVIPPPLQPFPGFSGNVFPAQKGFIVTQSLQGLLNYEVPPEVQRLLTNAPYHWRGDRADFLAFNGAFASLLGGTELADADMARFEDFINAVNYPPNPKQPRSRVLSGALGDPLDNDVTTPIDGSGALLGLKLFHIVNADGFACAGCHALPEGSDNLLTEFLAGVDAHPVPNPPFVAAPGQPLETAALRGLFQKEARLDRDGSDFHEDSPVSGYEGLLHTGLIEPRPNTNDFNGVASLNAFNLRFFNFQFCGPQGPLCSNVLALNQFMHEFDFGVAPGVGRTATVTVANKASAAITQAFIDAEADAAAANTGLAVQAQINGGWFGAWFDLTLSPARYRQEPGGLLLTRAQLLAQVLGARDRLVLVTTPLGSERRVAAPSGVASVLAGPVPASLALASLVPNTAHADVPALGSLMWNTGVPANAGTRGHTVRLYQNALLTDGPAGSYGLCSVRHEAPRRLRIAGNGIRQGAKLHLFIQDDPASGPPVTTLRPGQPGQVPLLEVTLPIHPSGSTLEDGRRLWETAVELEPLLFYRLMTGRPNGAPGVIAGTMDLDFLFQILPEAQAPGSWSPASWNVHYVRIVNEDGTTADGGWQPLTIEPGPDCP